MLPLVRNAKRNQNANTWFPSVFDDFFNDDFFGVPVAKQFATPAVNIKETACDYDIQVAAPGMTKDEFTININANNELVINLEKKNDTNEESKEKGSWIRREFSYATYSQSFVIPDTVNVDAISAKMENGVLNIKLPKKDNAEETPASRVIEIS